MRLRYPRFKFTLRLLLRKTPSAIKNRVAGMVQIQVTRFRTGVRTRRNRLVHPCAIDPPAPDLREGLAQGVVHINTLLRQSLRSRIPPLRHARGYAPCYPRLEITKPNSPKHLMDCMAHWRECTHPLRRWPTGWAKPHKDCNITYVS